MTTLRILMVLGMPWDRRLGAPRVQIELGEQFTLAGHRVDKLSLEDVFPTQPRSRVEALMRPDFGHAAKSRLRAVAKEYDIIDAQHGDVPFSKREIGFEGLLVARSCGLFALYSAAERRLAARWGTRVTGHRLLRPYRSYRKHRRRRDQRHSLERADLVNVPNVDEERWVREELNLGDKTIHLPNGANAAYLEALGRDALSRRDRQTPEVVFIGSWTPRKGILDLPAFVAALRSSVPGVRFSFLGTGRPKAVVASDLGSAAEGTDIRVVPEFTQEELPGLVRGCTAGVLPSYIEAFGLGVLELAAAGTPTVAYDVPGPRSVLQQIDAALLAPEGDVTGLVSRMVRIIRLSQPAYDALQQRCIDVAAPYTWERIAAQHLEIYTEAKAHL